MLFYPCILYRVSFAKYAAAFFNISRSCLSILFSDLKRLSSSSIDSEVEGLELYVVLDSTGRLFFIL
jgi:hypothetical protein